MTTTKVAIGICLFFFLQMHPGFIILAVLGFCAWAICCRPAPTDTGNNGRNGGSQAAQKDRERRRAA